LKFSNFLGASKRLGGAGSSQHGVRLLKKKSAQTLYWA